jgi:hypothetical protein
METYTLICAVCNEPFTAKRKNANTCSQKCRNALSIWRKLTNTPDVITDGISPVTTPRIIPELSIKTDKAPVITEKLTTPIVITDEPNIPPQRPDTIKPVIKPEPIKPTFKLDTIKPAIQPESTESSITTKNPDNKVTPLETTEPKKDHRYYGVRRFLHRR